MQMLNTHFAGLMRGLFPGFLS